MNQHEEQQVIQWSKGISGEIRIQLNTTGDERSGALRDFCEKLETMASNVRVIENEPDPGGLPSIQVGSNLRYSAIPAGPEMPLFLDALSLLHGGTVPVSQVIRDRVGRIEEATGVRAVITQQCPTCPAVIRQLITLTAINRKIQLDIIDAMLFPELAQELDVQGVPTVFVGERFRWTGYTELEEILDAITGNKPSDFSANTIDRMLQEGNASEVAEMILEQREVFPAIIELLVDEKFATRLGAMAAMEMVTDRDVNVANQIVEPLWRRFDQVIEPMQIDILYLIGEAGTTESIPLMESVLNGPHREHVKEIAQEAIDSIKERYALS
ncbi:MAG: thioredoxin family protein [Dehalococcoidia bacterium]